MKWDPRQYGRFAADRGRPFHELVAAVVGAREAAAAAGVAAGAGARLPSGGTDVRRAVDLGCGRGELTVSLLDRWPQAHVVGVDASVEMLADAAVQPVPPDAARLGGSVTWVEADAREWDGEEGLDLVISNALLQWVPGHLALLERWLSWLAPGGTLALQVPNNFDQPAHQLLGNLRNSERWRDRLGDLDERSVPSAGEYLQALRAVTAPHGQSLDVRVWETTYHQTLAGDSAVLEWMKGTGLRPVLSRLADQDPSGAAGAEFEEEYGRLLADAYPQLAWGTVLPFRRLFVVAQLVGPTAGSGSAATLDLRAPGTVPDTETREAESAGGGRSALAVRPLTAEIHHVQISAPPGSEEVLRRFYSGVLGLPEVVKPAALAARGGAWFRSGTLELHLGIEEDFRPARKAHPGIRLLDEAELRALAGRLEAAGYPVDWDDGFPGQLRFHTADPHGNRLELMAPAR